MTDTDKIEIFVSYSHRDERLRQRLVNHLKLLEWQGLSVIWHDRKIGAGREWAGEIHEHLNTCHIILLLVSEDFMASDYCRDVEVKRALERHDTHEARVIPVILRSVFWENAPFSKLQALPDDGKPIVGLSNGAKDRAFKDIARHIYDVAKDMHKQFFSNGSSSLAALDTNSMRDVLLRLDYREQVRVFKQVIEDNRRAGAFLIHGEPEYGQRWLLNRLIRLVPGSGAGKRPFKFEFQRLIGNRSLEALWRELARWMNVAQPSPQKMIEQIYKLWQNQTIILLLDGLDRSNALCISQFMREFWEPLMDLAQRKPASGHHLLLFLIDDACCTSTWNIPFVERCDSNWKPHTLVKLKQLASFTDDILYRWVDAEDPLPSWFAEPGTIDDILAESCGGIPQLAFEHICRLCGHDWYEREAEWVKQYG